MDSPLFRAQIMEIADRTKFSRIPRLLFGAIVTNSVRLRHCFGYFLP